MSHYVNSDPLRVHPVVANMQTIALILHWSLLDDTAISMDQTTEVIRQALTMRAIAILQSFLTHYLTIAL